MLTSATTIPKEALTKIFENFMVGQRKIVELTDGQRVLTISQSPSGGNLLLIMDPARRS